MLFELLFLQAATVPPIAIPAKFREMPRPIILPRSAQSMSQAGSGVLTVLLRIKPDGRASDCAVTERSGSPLFDRNFCKLVAKRARYYPARDVAGRAVTSDLRTFVEIKRSGAEELPPWTVALPVTKTPVTYKNPAKAVVGFVENGSAKDCDVVESSGNKEIDVLMCRHVLAELVLPPVTSGSKQAAYAQRSVTVSLVDGAANR